MVGKSDEDRWTIVTQNYLSTNRLRHAALYEYFARVGGYPNNKRMGGKGLGRGIDQDISVSTATVEFDHKMKKTS
jgi:hypothetical protein